MMICPNCGAPVQEEYHTGGVVFHCSRCGLYLKLPYQSFPFQTADDTVHG